MEHPANRRARRNTSGTTGSSFGPSAVRRSRSAGPAPVAPVSVAAGRSLTSPARFATATRSRQPLSAADFVGSSVSEFMQGDARSGEVEGGPWPTGPRPPRLRQLGSDGTWWVLGSATANIVIDAPKAGGAIASPVAVSGSALAFEGTVDVEIRQDGARQPIGTDVVTGGGDIIRPFSGDIEFSIPTEPYGAVVFLTRSEQDGRVWGRAWSGELRLTLPALRIHRSIDTPRCVA